MDQWSVSSMVFLLPSLWLIMGLIIGGGYVLATTDVVDIQAEVERLEIRQHTDGFKL